MVDSSLTVDSSGKISKLERAFELNMRDIVNGEVSGTPEMSRGDEWGVTW